MIMTRTMENTFEQAQMRELVLRAQAGAREAFGEGGIDGDGSLLEFDYQEVRVAQAILRNSRQVFLAADHSKFHRNAVVRQGNLSQINAFFTDRQPPDALRRLMREHDVALYVADPSIPADIEALPALAG